MKKHIKNVIRILSSCFLLLMLSACGSSGVSSASSITLEAGKVVSFAEDIAGGGENGWSLPDNGGTWSQADLAVLNLKYDEAWNNGIDLVLTMTSFVNAQNPNISATINANDEYVQEIKFDANNPSGEISLSITKEVLSKSNGQVKISFNISNAAIPKELGTSQDERKLGIFLIQMVATPVA
jgi:hypothetical protein